MHSSTRFYLYGYKRASHSLKELQTALHERGFKAIRRDPIHITPPRNNDIILVWGSSQLPGFNCSRHINTPDKVAIASNKLKTFNTLQQAGLSIPKFTTEMAEANTWLQSHRVLCRTTLSSSGGAGIILSDSTIPLVPAPLYVKYQSKQAEYRVHVFKSQVIDTQQKRKREGATEFNPYIRNHANGWNFCREGIEPNQTRDNLAIQAVQTLQLDFGAVDIIYNRKSNTFYVLEVNTAPGLEGTTVQKYADALTQ